jgi:hypothetical protein
MRDVYIAGLGCVPNFDREPGEVVRGLARRFKLGDGEGPPTTRSPRETRVYSYTKSPPQADAVVPCRW